MFSSNPIHLWPAPSVEQTHRIAAMRDPVIRNLKITQAYHDLKIALTRVLGGENVSWCAYATWASKGAGKAIRGEHLLGAVREFLSNRPALERLASRAGLLSFLAGISAEVTEHIAEGNHLVFAEMAPLYADWVARFSHAPAGDRAELRSFLEQLRPGPVERGGQDMLIEAFTHYHEAMLAPEPKARAELILLANLLVGHHEQTRLQGPIARAMNAPLPRGRLCALIEEPWRALLTRRIMTIELPSVTLDLGEDLPPWSLRSDFPRDLREVTHPRLRGLLDELDLTPNTVAGSAARDWASLRDRMNFVVDFFRTRQQDRLLYDQPFTFLQVAAIAEDRVPHGLHQNRARQQADRGRLQSS
jgi:hypothetical protein